MLDGVNRVAEDVYQEWTRRAVPRAGDLILAREAPVGNVAIIPRQLEVCLGQRTVLIRPNNEVVNAQFLTYLLLGNEIQSRISGMTQGATVGHLNVGDIRSLTLPRLPERRIQDRIADVLSAYDDLIENNTKRIKILEEMARSLYRQWFVEFRFPGHEKTKFIETEIGRVPRGWEVGQLGEVARVTMGNSPKSSTYNDHGEGLPLLNGPVEFGERFPKRVKWTTAPSRICEDGDLIVCVRGSTTGKRVKSNGVYCLGRGVCAISSGEQSFIDNLFGNEVESLLAQTSGSTFPSWSGPVLAQYPVVVPPRPLRQEFESYCAPMAALVRRLDEKIDVLRTTRDLLLPRLISGEIELPP
jgi:type I restriction enzyme S subunit